MFVVGIVLAKFGARVTMGIDLFSSAMGSLYTLPPIQDLTSSSLKGTCKAWVSEGYRRVSQENFRGDQLGRQLWTMEPRFMRYCMFTKAVTIWVSLKIGCQISQHPKQIAKFHIILLRGDSISARANIGPNCVARGEISTRLHAWE